jgi:hypothetical protein
VAEELLQDLERHGGDVGARERGLDHVLGVAHRGDQDLGRELVGVVDLHDLPHQLHAVLPDVVDPPHERADVGRARLRHQERLCR